MKKVLVVLCLLTASMAFAQEYVPLRAVVFSQEEAEAFDRAHPELENPSEYYVIDEPLDDCSISQKAEKMLNLIMDKIIAILEEDKGE